MRIQALPTGGRAAAQKSGKRPDGKTEPHNPLPTPGPSGRRNQRDPRNQEPPGGWRGEHPGTLSPEHALSRVQEAAPESP